MAKLVLIDADLLWSHSSAFHYALNNNVRPTSSNRELMECTLKAMAELIRSSAITIPDEMVAAFNLLKE